MRKVLFIGIIVVFAIVMVVYNILGGFDNATLGVLEGQQYTIVGQPFYGKNDDDTLRIYFENAKQHHATAGGTLCILYYNEASQPKDTIESFIGVANPTDTANLPKGFEVRTLAASKAISATMTMNYAVRPSAEKINQRIAEFASFNNMSLQKLSIELYSANGDLQVVVPVQE